jgi:hypothetical protein
MKYKITMNVKRELKESVLRKRQTTPQFRKSCSGTAAAKRPNGKHQAPMDRGLGWKQDMYPINKPTFSGQLGPNPDLEIVDEISLIVFK